MRARTFDRSRLVLRPLAERQHELSADHALPLGSPPPPFHDPALTVVADRIRAARAAGTPVIVMMGAHVLRAGVTHHLRDLIERGFLTHVAMNGGAAIHDFELAHVGATTESVARYVMSGEFGLWRETGRLNEIAQLAQREEIGFGAAIGRELSLAPRPELSVLAAAYRAGIPATVHLGIGYDIVHEHPNCDGAALGAASYMDFLVFAESVRKLAGGVVMNWGTQVMGPEIFLKALSMARNVAHQEGKRVEGFCSAVFDLRDLGRDLDREPTRDDERYFFRPFKTLLVRTTTGGGEGHYVRGDHRLTLSNLHALLTRGTDP